MSGPAKRFDEFLDLMNRPRVRMARLAFLPIAAVGTYLLYRTFGRPALVVLGFWLLGGTAFVVLLLIADRDRRRKLIDLWLPAPLRNVVRAEFFVATGVARWLYARATRAPGWRRVVRPVTWLGGVAACVAWVTLVLLGTTAIDLGWLRGLLLVIGGYIGVVILGVPFDASAAMHRPRPESLVVAGARGVRVAIPWENVADVRFVPDERPARGIRVHEHDSEDLALPASGRVNTVLRLDPPIPRHDEWGNAGLVRSLRISLDPRHADDFLHHLDHTRTSKGYRS